MKLIVNKKKIEGYVKNLARVVNSKSALPRLSDILFDVNEDMKVATLTAADEAITLTYTLQLDECEGSGRFCVRASQMAAMLASVADEVVTFEVDMESNRITMQHVGGFSYQPIADADEFPLPQETKDDAMIAVLPSSFIRSSIKRSLWATATDKIKLVMSGINFAFTDESCAIAASDGMVLIKNVFMPDEPFTANGSFIMPKKVAKILPDMLTEEMATLRFDSQQCVIALDQMVMQFRLIEGNYPNYNAIIPKEFLHFVFVDRYELLYALNSVSPFSPTTSKMVVLNFSKDKLTIRSDNYEDESGAEHTITTTDYEGKDIAVGMNASTLSTMLQKLESRNVHINMTDETRAVVIDPEDKDIDGDITCLIMPMLRTEA